MALPCHELPLYSTESNEEPIISSKAWQKGTLWFNQWFRGGIGPASFGEGLDSSEKKDVMAEDIFDIVDELDLVIGKDRRSVIHAGHLRHRAVHILLRNARGQVFLQKRAPSKDKNPNRWDSSCSGHVDSGENYDQAAVRELEEELGIRLTIEQLQRICKFEATRETGMEFVWVYFGRHEGPFILSQDEISDGRFWDLPEVDRGIVDQRQDFSGAFRYIWTQVRSLLI